MSRTPRSAVTIFAGLSLAAVAVGCFVAAASGVSMGVWVRNPASWVGGALAGALILRFAGPRTTFGFLVAAPLGLALSLAGAGQLGVHRWLDLGPLHVNAAQVLLPPAIVALAVPALGRGRVWIAAVILLLLAAQPDASQATAFGGALFALLGQSQLSRPARIAAMVAVGLAMAASWLRPDPLGPVPEVEEILRLAWELSPMAAVAAWATLLAAVAAFALFPTRGTQGGPRALGAYAVLTALMPLFGPFPVPLTGMAMSPVVGLWLGAGLLAAQARRVDLSESTPAA